MNQVAHQAGAYHGFCDLNRLRSISTPPWMGCQSPSIKFAGTHSYTWWREAL